MSEVEMLEAQGHPLSYLLVAVAFFGTPILTAYLHQCYLRSRRNRHARYVPTGNGDWKYP